MDTKINFLFLHTLLDSKRAIEWCMEAGLIANKYECPRCGEVMKMQKSKLFDGYAWRCADSSHDVKRSLRRNTWFDSSKLSIHNILMITYMWCIKVPGNSIMRDLNISSDTFTKWSYYCRKVCVGACIKENDTLGGDGVIVEIGESNFGKLKSRHGKFPEGKWVIGGVEKGTNKCFMALVNERGKDVLLEVVKKYVKPGSTVISYCWKTYNCLQDESYRQLMVNEKINFKDPETRAETNAIDGTWSAIKRQMSKNQSKNQFSNYLYEYVWRRRHINDKKHLINHFLRAVIQLHPPATRDN